MTKANNFTSAQERNIREVGRTIEQARLALRMSVREAADRTVTSRKAGHLSDYTWRRVEQGTIKTGIGEIVYRPTADTLMAMAEVVGLDGAELCKKVELVPPPQRAKRVVASREIEEVRVLVKQLLDRLDVLERGR